MFCFTLPPATEVGHERSLTLKMFALNALMSYGSLLLTAYVYCEWTLCCSYIKARQLTYPTALILLPDQYPSATS